MTKLIRARRKGVGPHYLHFASSPLISFHVDTHAMIAFARRQKGKMEMKRKMLRCFSIHRVKITTLHHILPVFAGPARFGGADENLKEIGDAVWHSQLHSLISATLQLVGLPAPNIGKATYLDLLQDQNKRELFIIAMRFSYQQWDRKCSPPAPSLLKDFNELVEKEHWESL